MGNELYAVFGDLHYTHKTNTRPEAGLSILKKLRWAALHSKEIGIKEAIFSGDIFDNLNVYTPFSYIKALAEILRSFDRVFYITGNHDYHKAFGLHWEDEPIGMLHELAGNMINIDGGSPYPLTNGYNLVGREWKKKYDLGKGEDLECPEHLNPKKTIMVTHSYLVPEKYNIMQQYVSYESLKNPCQLYLVGHYHDSLGCIPYEDKDLLIMGSVFRKAVNEHHAPSFFVLNTSSIRNPGRVVIPHSDLEDTFIDTSAERELLKIKEGVASFVSALTGTRNVMTRADFVEAISEVALAEVPDRVDLVNRHVTDVIDEANL